MANDSKIQWTDATWNCLAGCQAVSPGCAKCYAAAMTRRLEAMGLADYAGLTTTKHFNGVVRTLPEKLLIPLTWKKPRRVFVNSMSDLFHEDVPDEFIDQVFAVMALCPQHTFQILTKRADRMWRYTKSFARPWGDTGPAVAMTKIVAQLERHTGKRFKFQQADQIARPLRNVWLGVSVEDQQRADERIPYLLKTPAAVRFLSCEPLLGPVDLRQTHRLTERNEEPLPRPINLLDWVIVGGESGPQSRPCNIRWIRSIVQQCKSAGVPCFVKQLGSLVTVRNDDAMQWPRQGDEWDYADPNYEPHHQGEECELRMQKKGGNPDEWPADLRVRQWPKTEACV